MLLQVLIATSGLLPGRPLTAWRGAAVRTPSVRMQFAQPPDMSDEAKYPRDPDGNILISWASLDDTSRQMLDMALGERNKERILEGQPKYEDVQAMVDAYVELRATRRA